jgi:hypothetical protein
MQVRVCTLPNVLKLNGRHSITTRHTVRVEWTRHVYHERRSSGWWVCVNAHTFVLVSTLVKRRFHFRLPDAYTASNVAGLTSPTHSRGPQTHNITRTPHASSQTHPRVSAHQSGDIMMRANERNKFVGIRALLCWMKVLPIQVVANYEQRFIVVQLGLRGPEFRCGLRKIYARMYHLVPLLRFSGTVDDIDGRERAGVYGDVFRQTSLSVAWRCTDCYARAPRNATRVVLRRLFAEPYLVFRLDRCDERVQGLLSLGFRSTGHAHKFISQQDFFPRQLRNFPCTQYT